MVFYIPLPTGTVGTLTFTVNNGTTKLFEKTTKKAVMMSRNQILVAPLLNCAGDVLILSETFTESGTGTVSVASYAKGGQTVYSGATISYSIGDNTNTVVYKNENTAKGAASGELMLAKKASNKSGTFTISGIPTNVGNMKLSFVTNRNSDNCNTVSSGTSGITVSNRSVSGSSTPYTVSYDISVGNTAPSTCDITITNTSTGDNARIDDISITVSGSSYTAPSITPENANLVIDIAAEAVNTASTTFTYSNNVDNLGVSAVVNNEAKGWLTAFIEGSTLTVSANKNDTGSDRIGTVTLRASGATATVNVTQPNAKVSAPGFSTVGGTFANNQSITLSSDTDGATIRYTTDGTTPTSTTGTVYENEAIEVSALTTIKAIAYKENWVDSEIVSQTYSFKVATPTFSPGSGASVVSGSKVTISCVTDGASIYYTTDGSAPTSSSTLYSSSEKVTITENVTLKAIAVKANWVESEEGSASYTISNDLKEVFVFNTTAGLSALSITAPSTDSNGEDLSANTTYGTGTVTMKITHGSTNTRIWRKAKNNTSCYDLRVYGSGGTIVFDAGTGKVIKKVEFTAGTDSNFSLSVGETAVSNMTWAPSGTPTQSVTFTATAKTFIGAITVTYE